MTASVVAGETELVAVDIGGTHARFAVVTIPVEGQIVLGDIVTLQVRDHVSFAAAWRAFAEQAGRQLPRAAAVALAGPVSGETIRLSNNPWVLRPAALHDEIGIDLLTVVNDFAAIAHAVARAREADFAHLTGPDIPLPAQGTISVVGPGTGLGVAHFHRTADGGYHVQATEGGHVEFASVDAIDDAILARLRTRYRRVSAERVVSGPGIVDIYAVLAEIEGRTTDPGDGDRMLWDRGMSCADPLAAAAIERFCLSLGSLAGDLALAHGAGAVIIAGGLGQRLGSSLARSGFASRFIAKGRFENMLASLPVKLITHPQPGLLGVAAAFAQQHLCAE